MNLFIINSAKEWGGTEKWALHTALGLADLGHTVYFGCRSDLFEKRAPDTPVKFVRFPFANNADLVTLWQLRSFMRRHSIDVVMPSKQREYFLAGCAAKLCTRTKVAGMFGIDRPIHNLRTWFVFCKLFDIVFVVAKKIITVLSATKGFDPEKCRVVYVGADPITLSNDVRQNHRREFGLDDSDFAVIGIGRLAPQKGFDYAINAFALLSKQHPDSKLLIVGSGDQEPYRSLAQSLGIANQVVFTGFRTNVPDLIQAADLFWLTSRSEGIPNTMLEAMAAKVPVVAFDIAGVAEVVDQGKNGILVPFENIQELARQTAKLMNDPPLMRQLGENGCQTVTNGFSMEKMCADTEKYLKELAGFSPLSD